MHKLCGLQLTRVVLRDAFFRVDEHRSILSEFTVLKKLIMAFTVPIGQWSFLWRACVSVVRVLLVERESELVAVLSHNYVSGETSFD